MSAPRSSGLLLAALCAALPASVHAGTRAGGVPGESTVSVVELNVGSERASRNGIFSSRVPGDGAPHGYFLSRDGSALALPLRDGFEIRKGNLSWRHVLPGSGLVDREVGFSPDGTRLAFHVPDAALGVGLVDLNDPGEPAAPKNRTLYSPPPGANVRAFAWSPRGDELLVHEHFRGRNEGERIRAVSLTGEVREVFSTRETIHVFSPVPSSAGSKILIGLPDGLCTIGADGKDRACLTTAPCAALANVEWSPAPGKEKVVLQFASPARGRTRTFEGTYLVHLDRRRAGLLPLQPDESIFELLASSPSVHTLWFSPGGKYVGWASGDAVFYREPDADPGTTVKLEPRDERGLPLEVRGFAWDASGKRLAVAAGNALFMHDAASRKLELAATFESEEGRSSFATEPSWRGDSVLVTVVSPVREHAPP